MEHVLKRIFSVFVMVVLLLSSACSSTTSASTATTSTSGEDTTLYVEVTAAPVGMHPLKTNDSPSSVITNQIYETLYFRSYDGTDYEPLLAESLPEFSDDGLTATIKLREGVTFQNGDPFTAEAVGYMIDSIKDDDYGALRRSIVESIVSYDIEDDHTIVLHLAYEDGVLVAKLAHTNSAIVNPELDKTQDLLVDPSGAGTGAYEYVSSTTGSTYTLKAYDGYWGGKAEVDNVVVDVVADSSTAVSRLQTGEADFFTGLTADNFDTASTISGYTAVNESTSAVYYLGLRSHEDTCINPLMANKDFRTALIQAIDVETYVDTMLNGTASYSGSIVGPTLAGYTEEMEDAVIGYDPDAAKATIDKNGWAGEEVTLLTNTYEWQQNLAVYIQAELEEVGIVVNIVSEEYAAYTTAIKEDTSADFIILSWMNVTGDGQQMLEPNFSVANGQKVKYNNAEFDAIVQKSAETTVLEDRQAAMLEAVNMIQGDAIVTPLYSANALYIYNSDKFENIKLDKGQGFFIKDFTVAE